MSLSIWMKLKPQKYRKMFTVGGKLTFSFVVPKLFDDLDNLILILKTIFLLRSLTEASYMENITE